MESREELRPSAGRRLIAGCIDLYSFFYVALLPLVASGAFALWSQGRAIGHEVEEARHVKKGKWWEDPNREIELDKLRGTVADKLFGEASRESKTFLDGLGNVLLVDEQFKKTLDTLLAHPYTELLSQTRKQGVAAFERHIKSSAGAKAFAALQRAVKAAAAAHVGTYVRAEVLYRLEQVFRYIGWGGLWRRIEKIASTAKKPRAEGDGVPEALHWTALIDRLVSDENVIGPATIRNVAIVRWSIFIAAALAIAFLALRDAIGVFGSPGKNHAGLAVVDAQSGAPASFRQRLARGVLLVVLLPVEAILALVDRRIGDRVAGTRVVTRKPAA